MIINLPQGIKLKPYIYGLSYNGELVYIGIHNGKDKYYFSGGTIPRKIGRDNMIKGVIEYSDIENLPKLEIYYINKYKPKFNLTSGGDKFSNYNCKHSKETVEKRKASFIKNKDYIKKLSEKTTIRNLNNNPSKILSISIRCIEDNNIFESIREAAKYYNIDNSHLSKHLKGKYKSVKGLTFSKD